MNTFNSKHAAREWAEQFGLAYHISAIGHGLYRVVWDYELNAEAA